MFLPLHCHSPVLRQGSWSYLLVLLRALPASELQRFIVLLEAPVRWVAHVAQHHRLQPLPHVAPLLVGRQRQPVCDLIYHMIPQDVSCINKRSGLTTRTHGPSTNAARASYNARKSFSVCGSPTVALQCIQHHLHCYAPQHVEAINACRQCKGSTTHAEVGSHELKQQLEGQLASRLGEAATHSDVDHLPRPCPGRLQGSLLSSTPFLWLQHNATDTPLTPHGCRCFDTGPCPRATYQYPCQHVKVHSYCATAGQEMLIAIGQLHEATLWAAA